MGSPKFLVKYFGFSPPTAPSALPEYVPGSFKPLPLTPKGLQEPPPSLPDSKRSVVNNDPLVESSAIRADQTEIISSNNDNAISNQSISTHRTLKSFRSKLRKKLTKTSRILGNHLGLSPKIGEPNRRDSTIEGSIDQRLNITPPRSLRRLFASKRNNSFVESSSSHIIRSQSSREENNVNSVQHIPPLSAESLARMWSAREDEIISLMHNLAGSTEDHEFISQNSGREDYILQPTWPNGAEEEPLLNSGLLSIQPGCEASTTETTARDGNECPQFTFPTPNPFIGTARRDGSINPGSSVFGSKAPYIEKTIKMKVVDRLAKAYKSSFLVRYFTCIIPGGLLLLVPIIISALVSKSANVGGVELWWFSIWLEMLWLTLWSSRILATAISWLIAFFIDIIMTNNGKWQHLGKALEIPVTLVLWTLALKLSFLPTMQHHLVESNQENTSWMTIVNWILTSCLIGAILNLVEKFAIQNLAVTFHFSTYAARIKLNDFRIETIEKLYHYSKATIDISDAAFEDKNSSSQQYVALVPKRHLRRAQANITCAFHKFGDLAGRLASDFTGRQFIQSNQSKRAVKKLLETNVGCHILARRTFRTFISEGEEKITLTDVQPAFENDEESKMAFEMLDGSLNGDLTIRDLEIICTETGKEQKSIDASLKSLDSVVSRLDGILVLLILCSMVVVFVTNMFPLSNTTLTTISATFLGLTWMMSPTAQELLQSLVFIYVKHPYDIGDRITIYDLTSAPPRDYYVQDISLFVTKLRRMEGTIVQISHQYLSSMLIVNIRRSGGISESIPLTVKYGTHIEEVERLRVRMAEFVSRKRRDYQENVLIELHDIVDMFSMNVSIVFFHRSNWQNEILRMDRKNKFLFAMLAAMQDLGIEGPQMRLPGQKHSFPFYVHHHAGQMDLSFGTKGVIASDIIGDIHADASLRCFPDFVEDIVSDGQSCNVLDDEQHNPTDRTDAHKQSGVENLMERGMASG